MADKQHSTPYYLDVKFGEVFGKTKNEPKRLNFNVTPIEILYIVQDINRLTPSFRLKFQDPVGGYSQLVPFDGRRNSIRIGFNRNISAEDSTVIDFDVIRAFPTSNLIYDVEGILQIPNLYAPEKIRSFGTDKSVYEHLSEIALEELKVDEVDISSSLTKIHLNILQPNWTTAELLNYLKTNLEGSQREAGYFCCIKIVKSKRVFVFKSLKELYNSKPVYYFTNHGDITYDSSIKRIYYPILDFKVYDNYKILGLRGVQKMEYSHFDYTNSCYELFRINLKNNEENTDDYLSLTKYFCIDGSDNSTCFQDQTTGRSTTVFNSKGSAKNTFYKRINDLSKIWIISVGLEDIQVGDIVSTEFLDAVNEIGSHQYNGYWLVERVIHSLGSNFGTRLLLTRNGIDTINETTLIPAEAKNTVKK